MNLKNRKPVDVYAIRCKENGKIYIGSTQNGVEKRIKSHIYELCNGVFYPNDDYWRRNNGKLHFTKSGTVGVRSIAFETDYIKYGYDGFEFFVLQRNVAYENRDFVEAFYIAVFRATELEFGYNTETIIGNRKLILDRAEPLFIEKPKKVDKTEEQRRVAYALLTQGQTI